jgi:hypothetical protein
MLLLTSLAAMLMLAGASLAADKPTEALEKYWNPLGGANTILVDVAEVEPNGSLATAQTLNCGDVLRPASIGAAADTDYVKFTAAAGTIITVGTDADGTTGQIGDTRIRLFNDSGALLVGDDDSGPGLYSLLTFTAAYTGTYYVGFAAYSATTSGIYKGFINCQTPQPPPANDQCAGAITIDCGNVNLSGTTQWAANDYTPTLTTGGCTRYAATGKDVVYKLNAVGGEVLDLRYTNTADGSIYLITDCANPTTTCVAGEDSTLSGQTETFQTVIPGPGTYYLILDSYGLNTYGTWTLTGSYACLPTASKRQSWGMLKSIYR